MGSLRGGGRLLVGATGAEHDGAIGERMRRFLRSGLWWAIVVLLIVAFLWFVPQLQGEYFSQKVPAEERPALVNEYRRTWAQIIGGFGLYFTWRRIDISQQELEATRDQQVTERFTRAIDQLGATDSEGKNKKLEIRLGGIYALERIAWDSPERDNSTVMEVLTAYVRENTPQAPWPSEGSSDGAPMSNDATSGAEGDRKPPPPLEPRRSTADIQAILDVLRRTQVRVPEEYRTPLDLRESGLQGADLLGANLYGTNLQEANLREANLREANLREAITTDEQLATVGILQAPSCLTERSTPNIGLPRIRSPRTSVNRAREEGRDC
jgi:Pentapeptide repeats (8 copies)